MRNLVRTALVAAALAAAATQLVFAVQPNPRTFGPSGADLGRLATAMSDAPVGASCWLEWKTEDSTFEPICNR